MTELEIKEIPPLDAGDHSLLDMHSMLNVYNVLRGELTLIGLTMAQKDDALSRSLGICDRLAEGLRDPVQALAAARDIEVHARDIMGEIDTALALHPGFRTDPEIQESLANLESVFAVLRVRAHELLARAQAPDRWDDYEIPALRQDFMEIFAAIEKNSRGRYRLIYNAALKQPPDYYIDFRIESDDGQRLRMPPVFQDVMRDLIANARKYTPYGGRITAALYAGADAIHFCVEDNGRGIPPDELTKVVEFGHRASNVGDVRTMGGGFGLTKAFLVTKQFGGRFWIASQLGAGTRIRIHVPTPAARAAASLPRAKGAASA